MRVLQVYHGPKRGVADVVMWTEDPPEEQSFTQYIILAVGLAIALSIALTVKKKSKAATAVMAKLMKRSVTIVLALTLETIRPSPQCNEQLVISCSAAVARTRADSLPSSRAHSSPLCAQMPSLACVAPPLKPAARNSARAAVR